MRAISAKAFWTSLRVINSGMADSMAVIRLELPRWRTATESPWLLTTPITAAAAPAMNPSIKILFLTAYNLANSFLHC